MTNYIKIVYNRYSAVPLVALILILFYVPPRAAECRPRVLCAAPGC